MDTALPPDAEPETVRGYHQRTKHRFERYAASPDFMDWSTQPDPFRRFADAETIPLPLNATNQTASFGDLFLPGRVAAQPSTLESLATLLQLSFGLSAWKAYGGDRWALRCNPSSGNLHPTEAYLVVGTDGPVAGGIYHYQSHDHGLERRCRADLPFSGLLVGLSSIHWREAWKYGERAFRYCQHDIGHALGALRYAAALLGWRVRLLDHWGDADVAALLGLDRPDDFTAAEAEAPDLLCRIELLPEADQPPPGIDPLLAAVRRGTWSGRANSLSGKHRRDWPVIDQVQRATLKPRQDAAAPTETADRTLGARPLPISVDRRAAELIQQRRSAQAFDGVTAISARALYRILDACLPHPALPPFDAWPFPPRIHLALFIHRVEGLAPGLYLLLRHRGAEGELRQAMRSEFEWSPAEGCPDHIGLFRLVRANAQKAAARLSCHQEIAGASAFSLGMLAEFDAGLAEGPWVYRRLFWECGLIGQCLYLEAEAAGVRGTGIGCFFDDPVHELLGLTGTRFQSLYHFTVGGPLLDDRLQTLPPYGHLSGR